jgi:hypothetical protein
MDPSFIFSIQAGPVREVAADVCDMVISDVMQTNVAMKKRRCGVPTDRNMSDNGRPWYTVV